MKLAEKKLYPWLRRGLATVLLGLVFTLTPAYDLTHRPPEVRLGVTPSRAETASPREPPAIVRTEPGAPHLRVVARARAGCQPKSVVTSPEGALVYVCNFGRPDRESVTIHDADTLERVGVIEFPGNAVEAAFSRDGQTLYVSNFRRHVVEVIDVATRTVRSEIAVGQHP